MSKTQDDKNKSDSYGDYDTASLDYKAIGLKIKSRRKSLGITQERVANKLGVNVTHVSNIECANSHPSLSLLIRIASILRCSVDQFIGSEYRYEVSKDQSIEDQLNQKIQRLSGEEKEILSKMLDGLIK